MALTLLLVLSQVVKGQSVEKWLDKGETARLDKSIPKAIEYFEWAQKKGDDIRASIGLGLCYRELRKPFQAAKHFTDATAFENPPSEVFFYLSQCLQSMGDPEGAQVWFDKYSEHTKSSQEDANYWEMFERSSGQADLDSNRLIIAPFSHNTSSSDFSAVPWRNSIVFCSSRKTTASIVRVSTLNNTPLVDLYEVAQLTDSSRSQKSPEPLNNLNSKFNEGPVCFSKDEDRVYFTRNNVKGRRLKRKNNKLNRLRIYQSDWANDEWSEPIDLPFNNDDYANGHPCLSPNGQYLYFASEMPGGFGGADLYRTEILPDGQFGPPTNLGSSINTRGDELFPYVHTDGMLFFASDYHVGYGGLDIFKAIPVEMYWSSPINMGDPMNSIADDFGFWMYPNQRKGFFSSNRGNESENDDIYEFSYDRPPFECVPMEKNSYCYRFRDVGGFNLETDSMATLIYEWNFSDGGKEYGPVIKHCFPGPGDYLVQLNLIDTISGFVFMNRESYDVSLSDIQQIFIDCPDTVIVGESFKLSGEKSIFEDVGIREYEWTISGEVTATEVETEHVFTETGTFEIGLGVTGYQAGNPKEKRGCSAKKILVLAPERAKEIQDSIRKTVVKVIEDQDRWARYTDSLKALKVTFGTSNPLPNNSGIGFELDPSRFTKSVTITQMDAVDGNPIQVKIPAYMEGKQVKVLIRNTPLWAPGMPDYILADPNPKDKGYTMLRNMETNELELRHFEALDLLLDPGCIDCLPVSRYELFPNSEDLVYEVVEFKPLSRIIEEGLVVRINNIYFDYNSYALKRRYSASLDRLLSLMAKYPQTIIEVMGHTDSDGSDHYNEVLSRNRALSIAKFFALRGLGSERLIIKGLGEKQPVNSNGTAYGKQLNRRVEFRFNAIDSSSL